MAISLILTFPLIGAMLDGILSGAYSFTPGDSGIDDYVVDFADLLRISDNAIGIMALLLFFVGISFHRKGYIYFYASLAILFLILSFGKSLHYMGESINIPLPYIFQWIPILNNLRAPERFLVLVMLCISIVSSGGVRHITQRAKLAGVTLAVIMFAISFEYAKLPFPTHYEKIPDVYSAIAEDTDAQAILDIPFFVRTGHGYFGDVAMEEIYYQTQHNKKIFSGFYARLGNSHSKFHGFLNLPLIRAIFLWENGVPLQEDDMESETRLSREVIKLFGIDYIVFHKAYASGKPVFDWITNSIPLTLQYYDDDIIVYKTDYQKRSHYFIDCGSMSSIPYLMHGWINGLDEGSRTFAWMRDSNALVIANLDDKHSYELKVTMKPYAGLKDNALKLSINEKEISVIKTSNKWQTYTTVIPREKVINGINYISFSTNSNVELQGGIESNLPRGITSEYLKYKVTSPHFVFDGRVKNLYDFMVNTDYFVKIADWEQDTGKIDKQRVSIAVDEIEITPL
jgi:hypothetical protein